MSNMINVIQQIKKERDQAQKRVEQLDKVLQALTRSSRVAGIEGRRSRRASPPRRTMSAAAPQAHRGRATRVGQSGSQPGRNDAVGLRFLILRAFLWLITPLNEDLDIPRADAYLEVRFGEAKDEARLASRPRGLLLADFPQNRASVAV